MDASSPNNVKHVFVEFIFADETIFVRVNYLHNLNPSGFSIFQLGSAKYVLQLLLGYPTITIGVNHLEHSIEVLIVQQLIFVEGSCHEFSEVQAAVFGTSALLITFRISISSRISNWVKSVMFSSSSSNDR